MIVVCALTLIAAPIYLSRTTRAAICALSTCPVLVKSPICPRGLRMQDLRTTRRRGSLNFLFTTALTLAASEAAALE